MQTIKSLKKFLTLFLSLALSTGFILADNPVETPVEGAAGKLLSVSGYLKDSKTGEVLIGATVYVREIRKATSTNQYGFYSISMMPGNYNLDYSYVGYQPISQTIDLKKHTTINLELSDAAQEIGEVIVKSEGAAEKIKRAEMSVSKLEMKTIKKIPALMGEVDVIKVIQMLPGVQPTAEGSSGYSVRGGGIDQNLIVLDEATVYNASHLMGFFSVFNNDAVKDVKLYKGDIPAAYGGRLSSVLDVRMKDGNSKKFSANGGIGLISSRLTVEGPIIKDRTSFLISGRRTYADLFFPLFPDKDLKKATLYFYDFNLKLNHQLNENNRLYLSAYLGQDNFGQKGMSNAGFGNKTLTMRWNHQFSSLLFMNLTGIVSNYHYLMEMSAGDSKYVWNSDLLDYSMKADFNLYANPENEIKFGIASTRHAINPCDAYVQKDTTRQSFPNLKNYELEHGIYVSNQQKIGEKIILKYGVRYSIFQNIGKSTLNKFDGNHSYTGSVDYEAGKIFNTYSGFEPRFAATFVVNDISSFKASYSRTIQYLQLASNSNGGMPLDYWFPASPNVKPQQSDQYAVGYFRNFSDNKYEASVETFYKDMTNVVDFKDHAQLLFNDRLEGDIRSGNAYSYGAEFLIKKNEGKLTGWISYTYSRAKRKIREINNGVEYSAPYDKPHNVNIIVSYEITPRISASANWVYASGTPITFPVGSFSYANNTVSIYSGRNQYRMRDYHRLDLSVSIKDKEKANALWQGEWVFSMYNAYGRHNDWIINFVDKEANVETKVAERTYLPFLFFPAITYNFNF